MTHSIPYSALLEFPGMPFFLTAAGLKLRQEFIEWCSFFLIYLSLDLVKKQSARVQRMQIVCIREMEQKNVNHSQ